MKSLAPLAPLAAMVIGVWTAVPAHANSGQVIEGCHYSSLSGAWIYADGSLCRGDGEDPMVNRDGSPACAEGRTAVVTAPDRVMCVNPSVFTAPLVLDCYYAPQNRWDARCVGVRYGHLPPGYNTDDKGTWGRYDPWQGDCDSLGG